MNLKQQILLTLALVSTYSTTQTNILNTARRAIIRTTNSSAIAFYRTYKQPRTATKSKEEEARKLKLILELYKIEQKLKAEAEPPLIRKKNKK